VETAKKMIKLLNKKGKSTKSAYAALDQFQDRQIGWFLFLSRTYGSNMSGFKNKYMFLPGADMFYQNLGHFVSALHSATNYSLTAATDWELLGEAIDETTGGWLIKPFYYGVEYTGRALNYMKELAEKTPEFFNDMGSALQTIITIMKWGSVAGGLYLLYGALKPEKAAR
jgi:hypothetical protein